MSKLRQIKSNYQKAMGLPERKNLCSWPKWEKWKAILCWCIHCLLKKESHQTLADAFVLNSKWTLQEGNSWSKWLLKYEWNTGHKVSESPILITYTY